MTTITLTPDIERPLIEEATRQGTTPEQLALDALRRLFASAEALPVSSQQGDQVPEAETLFDFLQGYIGTISGTSEALSENCSERFAQGMLEKYRAGKL